MEPQENRLGGESSPYLRQHRFDPVDWYPYGEEALGRARELDRPLFLSIGYSACHWCHVMAHESFADPVTAQEMNRSVVAVKVDREERPDVDSVYMEAVLSANGHGGWPMSVFATPDGRPFFAGTYFPDAPRHNMPSFRQVLAAVSEVWTTRRSDVEAQADALARAVEDRMRVPGDIVVPGAAGQGEVSPEGVAEAVARAVERLGSIADLAHGGFGDAPKFPQPLLLDLLCRAAADGVVPKSGPLPLDVVLATLEAMGSGGIYDQLSGGFCRYSVDAGWVVPHFEKMLYDQVLLARVHLHAWQLTGDDRWRQILGETLDYVLGRLAHESGGLCSAEDADSEGEEGRYYLWSSEEVEDAVGPELAPQALSWFAVSKEGNFEGRNILVVAGRSVRARPPAIEEARQALARRREERVRPGLDDKVLTEWNAMGCAVLAEVAAVTGDERYAEAARTISAVLLKARSANGGITPRLVHPGRRPTIDGFAGDVAWLLEATTRLFELTGDRSYLDVGRSLATELASGFVDSETGEVFTTRRGKSDLVVRPAEIHDGVIPSGASVAAVGLARLGALLGEDEWTALASKVVCALWPVAETGSTTVPELLLAADLLAGGAVEIAAAGLGRELLGALRSRFVPSAVFVWEAGETAVEKPLPLLEGRGEDGVYVCHRGSCRLPAGDVAEASLELDAVLRARAGGAP